MECDMAIRELPSVEVLRQLLAFDPDRGRMWWKLRSADFFKSGYRTAQGNANLWNARYAGEEAFTCVGPLGYLTGRLPNAGAFLAHRVLWKLATGTEPVIIDHIDGNPSNNAIANLRSVTQAVNGRNRKTRSDSPHGCAGVEYTGFKHRPWKATIGHNGKIVYIGAFETQEEAITARKTAEDEYGWVRRE
jgi:HNH endonuclease